jgi:geranylgeranyl diphosphate synthase type II
MGLPIVRFRKDEYFAPRNTVMEQFAALRQELLDYLDQARLSGEPPGLYAPIDYIMDMGGKRIRPLLALLAARLFDAPAAAALPVAAAVEVFHNFSLVHDDMMDESPLRRGQPTVHLQYNPSTAILAGDRMLIGAYQHLMQTPRAAVRAQLIDVFNRVATGVCEGQMYDMEFETRDSVSIEEYLRMIELKTAVLLGGSLEMGALAAGAPPADAGRLYEFGRLIGIAFQLQDDYLDVFGAAEKVGKRVGNDILQNKKTFLYLKACAIADAAQAAELQRWYTTAAPDPARKVAAVTDLMRQLDIPRLTAAKRDSYQARALASLAEVDAPDSAKAALRQLAESLLNREY